MIYILYIFLKEKKKKKERFVVIKTQVTSRTKRANKTKIKQCLNDD